MKAKKTLLRHSIYLIFFGIAINICGAQLALACEWPLFLDSIGTILVGSIGGFLPGIIVGFFSNAINAMGDSITLYYGIISILIAMFSSIMAKRGFFKNPLKSLLAVGVFACLGGGLGSIITWLLYGLNLGEGISAPLAIYINDHTSFNVFWSQFTADMAIDLLDKVITVSIVFSIVNFLPKKFLAIFPKGYLFIKAPGIQKINHLREQITKKKMHRLYSLRDKVTFLILITAVLLSAASIAIGYSTYRQTMNERYIETCQSAVKLADIAIDNDRIDEYVNGKLADSNYVTDEAYQKTEQELLKIRDAFPDILYLYVYQIREDGIYVVFDLDTEELAANELGDFLEFDESFAPYLADLQAGKEIEPVISDDTFGHLLTVYQPLKDHTDKVVAYVAVDIDMGEIMSDRYTFIIRIVSLLFGASIIIIGLALRYADSQVVEPLNDIIHAIIDFSNIKDEKRIKATKDIQKLDIRTGDEIERLYQSVSKTFIDVSNYIFTIQENAETIAKMQDNIIISFANMVENRDGNTGQHVLRTASYVEAVAKSLAKNSQYHKVLTKSYIENLKRSAPLHDIGKIRISDIILNKPGKLTPEEFAIIKTHTTAGREILTSALEGIEGETYLNEAISIATYHHEKWNGTGYPMGLAGDDIPLGARIMAIADVFDALVSKRSYKEAYSYDEAFSIIIESSGSHFDPAVVDAFMAIKEEIIDISNQYIEKAKA